jgi:hypothetical protein
MARKPLIISPVQIESAEVGPDSRTAVIELPAPGRAIQVDMAYTRSSPELLRTTPCQRVLGYTRLQSEEVFIVISTMVGFDLNIFWKRSDFTWSRDRTVMLTELNDPKLNVVLVGAAGGNGLMVLEVSNVAAVAAATSL